AEAKNEEADNTATVAAAATKDPASTRNDEANSSVTDTASASASGAAGEGNGSDAEQPAEEAVEAPESGDGEETGESVEKAEEAEEEADLVDVAQGAEGGPEAVTMDQSETSAEIIQDAADTPEPPSKAVAKVVTGSRKQRRQQKLKQKQQQRQSGKSADEEGVSRADSMNALGSKKRRPALLSNCARTLKNKVRDASRSMLSLVARTDETMSATGAKQRLLPAADSAVRSVDSLV
uniref:Retinitis pigmentosa 1-like 1 n=1 Tax=Macrostomum lignano TaxID=282301 RepID=A0A1I8I5G1_9PLAT